MIPLSLEAAASFVSSRNFEPIFYASYNFAQMKIFARKKWNIFSKDQNVRLDIFLQSNTDDEICTQANV